MSVSGAPDLARIRADVEALAAMTRSSAREGERESAAWLRERLQADGVDARIEPYRSLPTYGVVHAAHHALALAGALRTGKTGAALALGALALLDGEVSGRRPYLRKLLPTSEGANVVARIPAAKSTKAALAIVAHHDAANTGLVWHPKVVAAGDKRRLERRKVDPFMSTALPLYLGAALGSRIAAAGLAVATALELDVARSPTVPGASDNATGVAVTLDLARRIAADPPGHVETWIVLPGSEESGMGGMRAFLAAHGAQLKARRSLVLGLDTLGAGTPIVADAEGALRTQRYRPADLELADEGAAIAGLPRPQRWRLGGWTDPVLALDAGLPAISLLAMGPGHFPNYHHPTDTPDRVDYTSVEHCARIAAGTIAAFARRTA